VATSTMTISVFYLMAQMVGAGALLKLLLGLHSPAAGALAIAAVGALMIIYVAVGGMIGTTWVQIIKAVLLIAATTLLIILVLAKSGFSISNLIQEARAGNGSGAALLNPGQYFKNPLDLMSLALALVLGTAGLPHVLMRFYTVPNARAARSSATWAIGIIGCFYIGLCIIGLGAAAFVGKANIIAADPAGNLAAPLLAGNDIRSMTDDTRDILTNGDVIAVDQDPLLVQGRPLPGDPRVIVKRLADGAVAVALFNPDADPVSIRTNATSTGVRPADCYTVRDLWAHEDATTTGDLERTVPGHGVAMLRVTPGCR